MARISSFMALISKGVLLVGLGLSVFAISGAANILEQAIIDHFHRDFGLGLAFVCVILYGPVISKLYQSKNPVAKTVTYSIVAVSYIFLFTDVGRIIMLYRFTHWKL